MYFELIDNDAQNFNNFVFCYIYDIPCLSFISFILISMTTNFSLIRALFSPCIYYHVIFENLQTYSYSFLLYYTFYNISYNTFILIWTPPNFPNISISDTNILPSLFSYDLHFAIIWWWFELHGSVSHGI